MPRWNRLPKDYQKKQNSENVYKPKLGEKEAKLVIPGKFPTLNNLIDKAKENMHAYQRLKEEQQAKIGWYIKQQEIPFFKKVKIEITYYRPDKRADIDNISAAGKKIILDALVEQGTIPDDCWSVVRGFEESFEVDSDNPRTEVILKEVKDES